MSGGLARAVVLFSALANVALGAEYASFCYFGASPFQGRCYKYVSNAVTWAAAETECNREGMRLASVHSDAEKDKVGQTCQSGNCWIGLYQLQGQTGMDWSWTDATYWDDGQGNVRYHAFSRGEPNDWGSGEDCVHQYGTSNLWNDLSCSSQLASVCVRNAYCKKGWYRVRGQYYRPEEGLYVRCEQCPAGTYNDAVTHADSSVCQPCPAGTVGLAGQASVCSTACPKGYWCPAGTDQNAAVDSAAGPQTCPAGTYGSREGLGGADECSPCSAGYYCPSGIKKTSPEHEVCYPSYCGFAGQSAPECSQACPAGYLCGPGTACPGSSGNPSNVASECGGANRYCPQSSTNPRMVSDGFYSVGGNNQGTTRTAQVMCEPGHYCTNGVRHNCPPGTYVATVGSTSAAACSPCMAGYLCPADNVNTGPKSLNCYDEAWVTANMPTYVGRPAELYCEAGAAVPKTATAGFYTYPTGTRSTDIVVREALLECPKQFVCPGNGYRENLIRYWGTGCDRGNAWWWGYDYINVPEMAAKGHLLRNYPVKVHDSRVDQYDVNYRIVETTYLNNHNKNDPCNLPYTLPMLTRNNFVKKITVPQNWRVEMTLTVHNYYRWWTNLYRVGNSNYQRVPAIWVYPNQPRLHIRTSSTSHWNDGCDPHTPITLGKEFKLTISYEGTVIRVWYDDLLVCKRDALKPFRVYGERNEYISDPWYHPAVAEYSPEGLPAFTEVSSTDSDRRRRLGGPGAMFKTARILEDQGPRFREMKTADSYLTHGIDESTLEERRELYEPTSRPRTLLDESKNEGIFELTQDGNLQLTRDNLNYEVCLPQTTIYYHVFIAIEAVHKETGEVHGSKRCRVQTRVQDQNDKPEFIHHDEGDGLTTETTIYHRQIVEKVDKNVPVTLCDSQGNEYGCPLESQAVEKGSPLKTYDEDDGAVIRYTIHSGDDGFDENPAERKFKIDSCTGLISAKYAQGIRYIDKKDYTFVIKAEDDGVGGRFAPLTDFATVKIYVIDINDAPVMPDDEGELTITENLPAGSATNKMIEAYDEDFDALTYDLVSNDGDAFAIVDNKLVTTAVGARTINFESSKSEYFVEIRASDGRGGSHTGIYAIQVLNSNDAPQFFGQLRFFIKENSPDLAQVCLDEAATCSPGDGTGVKSFDEDNHANDVTTYKIVGGASDKFGIHPTDGIIYKLAGVSLDFETSASINSGSGRGYAISVEATSPGIPDQTPRSSVAEVVVFVVDENEQPAFGNLPEMLVRENWPVGYRIPGFVFAEDPDNADAELLGQSAPQQTLTYSNYELVDTEYFIVETDAQTGMGVLKVAKALDFEELERTGNNPLSVRIKASDNGGPISMQSEAKAVQVRVVDANEAPVFDADRIEASGDENKAFQSISSVSAADEDAGSGLAYSVIAGSGEKYFEIEQDGSGFLVKSRALIAGTSEPVVLNFEDTSKEWSLVVQAEDSGPSAAIAQLCQSERDETESGGECGAGAICKSGRCHELCYDTATTLGPAVAHDQLFMCDYKGETPQESVNGVAKPFFKETAEITYIVNIQDKNDPPTLSQCPLNIVVAYNLRETDQDLLRPGQLVQDTEDEDAPGGPFDLKPYTYSISSGGRSFLSLADPNGQSARLVYSEQGPDSLTALGGIGGTFSLVLSVADSAGASSTCQVNIEIIDKNTAPILSDATGATISEVQVSQDPNDPTVILDRMTVTDPDADDTPTFRASPNPYFEVDSATGQVTLGSSPVDYESLSPDFEYRLIVQVKDSRGAEDVAEVVIPVTDVNEAPNFSPVPAQSIAENLPAGTVVIGALLGAYVNDPDVFADASWRTVSFSLRECAELPSGADCPFTVDPTSGKITTSRSFNYEDDVNSWTLVVIAEDAEGASSEQAIVVSVSNVDEAPTFAQQVNEVSQIEGTTQDSDSVLLSLSDLVTDEDAADREPGAIRYEIVRAVPVSGAFAIDSSSALLKTNNYVLDYESAQRHEVTIKAIDTAGLEATGKVVVNVENVNDVRILAVASATLTCESGGQVEIDGENFGLATASQGTDLVVEYTSIATGAVYSCADPVRVSDAGVLNTKITCTASSGIGNTFKWTVKVAVSADGASIAGDLSPAYTSSAAYYPEPVLASVLGADDAFTGGGASVILSGECVGRTADYPSGFAAGQAASSSNVRYCNQLGDCYQAAECGLEGPNTVKCLMAPGLGNALQWTLTSAGQTSSALESGSYGPPEVFAASADDFSSTGTFDSPLVFTGTNFGALGSSPEQIYAQLVYSGQDAESATRDFSFVDCVVTAAYEELTCQSMVPGMGAKLPVAVTFGGQESPPEATIEVSYAKPIIKSFSGEGVSQASTRGGQQVVIRGSGFGPSCGKVKQQVEGGPVADPDDEEDTVACEIMSVTYSKGSERVSDGSTIVYESKCAIVSQTQMTCLTAPGTGAGLEWTFDMAFHAVTLPGATTSYDVPTVGGYDGPGSSEALTSGFQAVVVKGANFGPLNGALIEAYYGDETNPREFGPQECTLIVEHERIECLTLVGAGRNLKWTIYVDGQESIADTTDYGKPEVHSFDIFPGDDVNVAKLNNNGGAYLIMRGKNFGGQAPSYLEEVTCGPLSNPQAYQPACEPLSHTELGCTMPPGVGLDMRWQVRVRGQSSLLSSASASYEAPAIQTVSADRGITDGGYRLRILAEGAAVCDPEAIVSIRFGDAHLAPIADTYDHQKSTIIPVDLETECPLTTSGAKSYEFIVPEMTTTHAQSITLQVGSRRFADIYESETFPFTYDSPVLDAVYAEPVGSEDALSVGQSTRCDGAFRVTLRGDNFCSSSNCCQVYLNGRTDTYSLEDHSHRVISVCTSQVGFIFVKCGEEKTDTLSFNAESPFIFQTTTRGPTVGSEGERSLAGIKYPTRATGQDEVDIWGLYFGGATPLVSVGAVAADVLGHVELSCDSSDIPEHDFGSLALLDTKCYKTTIVVPSGVGKEQGIVVQAGGSGSDQKSFPSNAYEKLNYHEPVITEVVTGYDGPASPTVGGDALTIRGEYFGSPELLLENATVSFIEQVPDGLFGTRWRVANELDCLVESHEVIKCVVPPGEGAGLSVFVTVSNQDTEALTGQFLVNYLPPIVTVVEFSEDAVGNTEGGDTVRLYGENFGRTYDPACVSLSESSCTPIQPVVAIGGLACVFESNNQTELLCETPPGEGKDLAISIQVRNQVGASVASFSYAPPEIDSYSPLEASTDGVDGSTGLREIFEITGRQFGNNKLTVFFVMGDSEDRLQRVPVAQRDLGEAGTDDDLNDFIQGTGHQRIMFYVPPLRGKEIEVQVEVAGQTVSAGTLFAYREPVVSGIVTIGPDGEPKEWEEIDTDELDDDIFPLGSVAERRALAGSDSGSVSMSFQAGPGGVACERSIKSRGYSWKTTLYTLTDSSAYHSTTVLYGDELCSSAQGLLRIEKFGNFTSRNGPEERRDLGCTTTFERHTQVVLAEPVSLAGLEFAALGNCCPSVNWGLAESTDITDCLEASQCEKLSAIGEVALTGSHFGVYTITERQHMYMSNLFPTLEALRESSVVQLPDQPTMTMAAPQVTNAPGGPTNGCYEYESYQSYLARRREAIAASGNSLNVPDIYRKCVRKARMQLAGENFSTNLYNTTDQVQVIFFKNETDPVTGNWTLTEFRAATTSSNGDFREPCTEAEGCMHDHSKIIFQTPLGYGRNLKIRIQVGNQAALAKKPGTDEALLFHYDQPELEFSMPGSLFANNGFLASSGETMRLLGANFGGIATPANALVDGKPCTNAQWQSGVQDEQGEDFVSCVSGPQVSGPKAVFVCVAGQAAFAPKVRADSALLSEADRIQNTAQSSQEQTLTEEEIDARVNALYLNTASLANSRCRSTYDAFGNALGQTGGIGQLCTPCPNGAVCNELEMPFQAPASMPGFYRMDVPIFENEQDTTVTERAGRNCPKERWDVSLADDFPELVIGDTCDEYVSCEPAEACVGGNECSAGYTYNLERCQEVRFDPGYDNSCRVSYDPFTSTYNGVHSDCNPNPGTACDPDKPEECAACNVFMDEDGAMQGSCECQEPNRCALCSVFTHFRLHNRCKECPKNPELVIAGFGILIVVTVVGGYWLSKKNINLALFGIVIDFLQVLAVFSSVNITWPQGLIDLFNMLAIFNLNIDIAAPECLVPTLEYEVKWFLMETLPIFVLAGLILVFFFYATLKLVRYGTKAKLMSHAPRMLSVFLLVMYVMYLNVTRKSLDIFNCNPLPLQDDGYLYTSFTSLSCDGGSLCRCGEGVQLRLQPLAAVFLVLYSLGFPSFVYVMLRRNRSKIMEDQYLRATGIGNSRVSNPRAYDIRKKYSTLYMHFKPERVTWIVTIIIRKFSVAFAALMFRSNATFQLSVVLLVLFTSFCLHLQYRPYLSTGERSIVLKELDEKAERGLDLEEFSQYTEMQRRVRECTKAAKEQEGHGGQRKVEGKQLWNDRKFDKKMKREERLRRGQQLFFDYNTVEGILLASSIFICLGGVMFSSGRFEGRQDIEEQRDFITYLIIICVILTLAYILLVVLAEIFPTITVRSCTKCLQVLQRRAPEKHEVIDLDEDLDMTENPLVQEAELRQKKDLESTNQALKKAAKENDELRKELKNQKRKAQEAQVTTGHASPQARDTGKSDTSDGSFWRDSTAEPKHDDTDSDNEDIGDSFGAVAIAGGKVKKEFGGPSSFRKAGSGIMSKFSSKNKSKKQTKPVMEKEKLDSFAFYNQSTMEKKKKGNKKDQE